MQIPGSYEDLIEQARRARAAGRMDQAIELYNRVIDRISKVQAQMTARDDQLHEHLTLAADELQGILDWEGEHTQARELCLRMAELDPSNRSLWRRRAASERVHAGEVEEGLAEIRELMREEPEDFWHPLELAVRLLDLGRYSEAEEALAEAAQRARDDEARALIEWTRFRALREQGRRIEAAQAWERARLLDPFYRQAVESVYRMFLEADDYENALLYLDLEENALLAGYYRGLIAHRRGDTKAAKKIWTQVTKRRPGDFKTGWEAWALALLRLGDQENAHRFLSELVKRGHVTVYSTLSLALVCAAMGDLPATQKNLEHALHLHRLTLHPRALLPAEWWRDFDELTSDEKVKRAIRKYFVPEAVSSRG